MEASESRTPIPQPNADTDYNPTLRCCSCLPCEPQTASGLLEKVRHLESSYSSYLEIPLHSKSTLRVSANNRCNFADAITGCRCVEHAKKVYC
ncbi:hypothetical protein AVEN_74200-1 [Araneus ventricosus]|uniref:Uncharacterized protein n=1 Tax=Araneus ventricosus TaxID=182803 RepID=A0A4Y2IBM5_ARAVE|nr:hypothetical protein AVEN_74200-1 [Araneus ventricosus]